MSYQRQVSQALDTEHRATLDLSAGSSRRSSRAAASGWPRCRARQLAGRSRGMLEQEVGRHFDFEERELFPRLADAGEGDIAALLAEEHAAIREVAA